MMLTTGLVFLAMVAGTALGQNPAVINNTRGTLQAVQQKHATASNAALAATQGGASNPATTASGPAKKATGASTTRIAAKPVAPQAKPAAARQKSQAKQQIAVENQKK